MVEVKDEEKNTTLKKRGENAGKLYQLYIFLSSERITYNPPQNVLLHFQFLLQKKIELVSYFGFKLSAKYPKNQNCICVL